ncbi:uncharacterized protein L969DRAFT_18249 [Mixia osmundae IAM 14324]|uniref:Calcineurin-like phosphoesterase domain-containing protein n=1 Tax=Mixia osmundae (strain CBS 9802 / IAM 14324 / JCM 22182 / KY 12970) TaxID=764103 RepID=G7DZ15_MIXOS|nr:uncharacterized protein L969DRAFT_18249 [Mixia osmundae IAM 14324]KEI38227.1 hypothetical protein L969DRAFT_18249 [Mixia osmundae IAM 14324]GAA95825.1 hypothetical protein E5Q_02482 [Mixia osmundae IAM 14324]
MLRRALAGLVLAATARAAIFASNTSSSGASYATASYTGKGVFDSLVYPSYYVNASQDEEPQPIIISKVGGYQYPLNLTSPKSIPKNDTVDAIVFPPSLVSSKLTNGTSKGSAALTKMALANIESIINSDSATWPSCAKCLAGLAIAQGLALAAPAEVPNLATALCVKYKFQKTPQLCYNMYSKYGQGPYIAQLLANFNATGNDGRLVCATQLKSACPLPPVPKLDLSSYFKSPKPTNGVKKVPTGNKRLRVLHLSDIHLDPRFAVGSEGNCTGSLCCRPNDDLAPASTSTVTVPAPRYGSFLCDSPFDLVTSTFQAIKSIAGQIDFTVFTGDITAHDPANELSRAYDLYCEDVVYDLMKKFIPGNGPVYASIGNHDSIQQAQAAPHGLGPTYVSEQFSWNYDHLSSLWQAEGWIDEATVQEARTHYGGYSVSRKDNLKIITLDTNLFYRANLLAYINTTNSDPSGILRFLTDELQSAEDAGQRAIIQFHVLTGWSGTNPLPGPSDLFYQIVDRYSDTIAFIPAGHLHEDVNSIYYSNNATTMSAATAQLVTWVGPSVTPLTNLNSGFRIYELDSETFDVLDAFTFYSNVSTYPELQTQTENGPTFKYEYSHRDTYGSAVPDWPANAPLNATWWHLLSEAMERNGTYIEMFNTLQGKMSSKTTNCTNQACQEAKVCYIRSASAPIALDNCSGNYSSVQGGS